MVHGCPPQTPSPAPVALIDINHNFTILLIHDMMKNAGPNRRLRKEKLNVNIRYEMIETLSSN